ncbi:MAG: L,D-transpeptidase family protein [Patescibacteria group bacterium]
MQILRITKYANKLMLTIKYFIIILLLFPVLVNANGFLDTDGDAVPDKDEIEIYKTDPNLADTDNDGYSDWVELNNGYSPLNPILVKLENNDYDLDGLSDRMELNFKTDLSNSDTDGDGYLDGEEINNGYDPLNKENVKLDKRIEINTGAQELSYFLGGVRLGKFTVSSGKNNSTPKGHYVIDGKNLKAWSSYGLWMPYWMSLKYGYFGIHELPVWPNGYREGEDHLGTPVSHGCIRLGIGPAEFLYNWSPVGTPVFIY